MDSTEIQALKDALGAKYPSASFETLVTTMHDASEVTAVVKLPVPEPIWGLVREKQMDPSPAEKASANRLLVNAVVVAVNGAMVSDLKAELKDVIKQWPGIVDTWAGEIGELAGAVRGTRREKF